MLKLSNDNLMEFCPSPLRAPMQRKKILERQYNFLGCFLACGARRNEAFDHLSCSSFHGTNDFILFFPFPRGLFLPMVCQSKEN